MTGNRPRSWQLRDAILGFVAAQILAALCYGAAVSVADDDSLFVFALSQLGLWTGLAGAPIVACRRRGTNFAAGLGWCLRLRDLGWVWVGVACQVALLPLLYVVVELLVGDLDVGAPARDLTDRYQGAELLGLALLVGIVAPVVEELFYRGLVLRTALERWGPRSAVAFSSAWFGMSHFQLIQLPALMAFGVVLALLTVRSRRLGPAIAAHIGFNVTTLVALILL